LAHPPLWNVEEGAVSEEQDETVDPTDELFRLYGEETGLKFKKERGGWVGPKTEMPPTNPEYGIRRRFIELVYHFESLYSSIQTWGEEELPPRVKITQNINEPARRRWQLTHSEIGELGIITLRRKAERKCDLVIAPIRRYTNRIIKQDDGTWLHQTRSPDEQDKLYNRIANDLRRWINDDLPKERPLPEPQIDPPPQMPDAPPTPIDREGWVAVFEYYRDWAPEVPDKEIAAKYGFKPQSVKNKRQQLNFPKREKSST
jgi:hypothetical protein